MDVFVRFFCKIIDVNIIAIFVIKVQSGTIAKSEEFSEFVLSNSSLAVAGFNLLFILNFSDYCWLDKLFFPPKKYKINDSVLFIIEIMY